VNHELRQATPLDWLPVRDLLGRADLPVEDLAADRMPDFVVCVGADGILAGAIGLERYGEVALLRSLVVDEAGRGKGLGGSLVAALEQSARNRGTRELWLLTNDANDFFAARGYEIRDRADAPDAIQGSAEFSSICPASAVLMSKTLA
jgi:amino-acid N-acetyltransferase